MSIGAAGSINDTERTHDLELVPPEGQLVDYEIKSDRSSKYKRPKKHTDIKAENSNEL